MILIGSDAIALVVTILPVENMTNEGLPANGTEGMISQQVLMLWPARPHLWLIKLGVGSLKYVLSYYSGRHVRQQGAFEVGLADVSRIADDSTDGKAVP